MRNGYPVEFRGGAPQQEYESRTKMQRNGIKKLLNAAGINCEGLRKVIDLDCRNGDPTLGLLEATVNGTKVFGVSEYNEALLIAKTKFDIRTFVEFSAIQSLIEEIPIKFRSEFLINARQYRDRVEFIHTALEDMPEKITGADLAVGYQLLHWLRQDSRGLPHLEILCAIRKSLAKDGIFLAGTSTAFVDIPEDERIEGKTKDRYSIDRHPFVQKVYALIEDEASKLLGRAPRPVTERPQLNLERLEGTLKAAGFADIKTGSFLVTPGREEVVTQAIRLRPIHQGRLAGVPEDEASRVVSRAVEAANSYCDGLVESGNSDPRLVETNIWDSVPFVMARRAD